MAKVGYERIEEINNPEKALNRSRGYWQKMGRDPKWIQQRMMGQEIKVGDTIELVVVAEQKCVEIERWPYHFSITFNHPDKNFPKEFWSA